jgi:hypothetical protein
MGKARRLPKCNPLWSSIERGNLTRKIRVILNKGFNTPAYYHMELIISVKRFIIQALGSLSTAVFNGTTCVSNCH